MSIVGFLFLLLFGLTLGQRFFPHENMLRKWSFGLLTTLAAVSGIGSLIYYLFAFTNTVILGLVAAQIILLFVWRKYLLVALKALRGEIRSSITRATHTLGTSIGAALVVGSSIVALAILAQNQTTDAMYSPWQVVPASFFIAYGIAIGITVALLVWNKQLGETVHIFLLSVLTFVVLSIAWILFPIGYGFDSFIHQATEKVIAEYGIITPKPLYYIGQYTLVVFLAKLFGISVVWIDKLLVPLLAAFLLPLIIQKWLRNGNIARRDMSSRFELGGPDSNQDREATRQRASDAAGAERAVAEGNMPLPFLATAGYLLLPFFLSQFIMTTPQALGNVFLISLIFLHTTLFRIQFLLAFAALVIHPLAGIPAFIFLFVKRVQGTGYRVQILWYTLLAFAIPLAFFLISLLSSQIILSFTPHNVLPWLRSIEWGGIYRENRFDALFDFVYFYGFNIKNIFWFFVLTTVLMLWRNKKNAICHMPYAICFFILLANAVVLYGFLSFDFLIGYEQTNYADRLLEIAYFFLLPAFLVGVGWWMHRALMQGFLWKMLATIILTAAILTSTFLSYPQRIDRYAMSRGINTSQADIDAVRWIDADARDQDYIVLANQAVSAAAIREFGFKKYYNSLYFYPIPTNSPLYQSYLDMVYPPKFSSEDLGGQAKNYMTFTMRQAMERVDAQRAYFVLNSYWTDSENILAQAKQELSLVHAINNRVFIFRN